jgi:hypothetical protein
MRKWLIFIVAGFLFVFPAFVAAQGNIMLSALKVQLWPEYDQPSMLVIHDFTVPPETQLPAPVTFHIPLEANLIAVASLQNGELVNIPVIGPSKDGEWQAFTVTVDAMTTYHFEYYEPLTFNGDQRAFNYLWDGSYAVNEFSIRVLQPVDAASMATDPVLKPTQGSDGQTYYEAAPINLPAGEQFLFSMQYQKSSDTLTSPQALQPAAPVDENTPGRISLANYLPYFLGGLGLALIFGGFIYYWRANRRPVTKSRRRQRANYEQEESDSEVYCHQCGTRAKPSDRFCRVCGTRLRQDS